MSFLLRSHFPGAAGLKMADTAFGLLEQFLGSLLLGATLSTQLRLRSSNFTGIGLFAIWLFSPIGGQAILKILSTLDHPTVLNVSYTNTRAPNFAGYNIFWETWYNELSVINSASLLAPPAARTGPIDLWVISKSQGMILSRKSAPPATNGGKYLKATTHQHIRRCLGSQYQVSRKGIPVFCSNRLIYIWPATKALLHQLQCR